MRDAGGRYRARGLLHAQGPLARTTGHCRKAKNRVGGTIAGSAGGRVVAGLAVWWTTARRDQPRLAPAVDPGTQPSRHSRPRLDSQLEIATTRRAIPDHRHAARVSHRAKGADELRRKHDRV